MTKNKYRRFKETVIFLMALCLFCGGFTQIVKADTFDVKVKADMTNSEMYRFITKYVNGKLEIIEEGAVDNCEDKVLTFDKSDKVFIIYFARPEKGYLITGAGVGGKSNMSNLSILRTQEGKNKTEGKVPEEALDRMEANGYQIAWGYTRHEGQRAEDRNIGIVLKGYKPVASSSITNTTEDLEEGKPISMEVIIKPGSAFRDSSDTRKFSTQIPENGVKVTIDDKKVVDVTNITRISDNEYKGTVSFILDKDDARVNSHKAVVNAMVEYKAQTSTAYSGEMTYSNTLVEAKPAEVNFKLVESDKRKIVFDLGFDWDGDISEFIFNVGERVQIDSKRFKRDGYELIGWFSIDNDGNDVLLKPDEAFIMPERVTGTKLKAKWDPVLTVNYDNGEAAYSESKEGKSRFILSKPVKEGHTFWGWRDENGREYKENEEIVMPEGPLSLTAIWQNNLVISPIYFLDTPKTVSNITTDMKGEKDKKNVDKLIKDGKKGGIEEKTEEGKMEDVRKAEGDKNVKRNKKSGLDKKSETDKEVDKVKESEMDRKGEKEGKDDNKDEAKEISTGKQHKTDKNSKDNDIVNSKDKESMNNSDKATVSVKAHGRGAHGVLDKNEGEGEEASKLTTDSTTLVLKKAKKGLDTIDTDSSGIPLYGKRIGRLGYKGKGVKGGSALFVGANTLPVTGGRVNVESWLGLSIISTLIVCKLLEIKNKKVK